MIKVSELKVKVIVPDKDAGPIRDFQFLLSEIGHKEISPEVEEKIGEIIHDLNTWDKSARGYLKQIERSRHKILKLLHRKLGIVHRNYYTGLWLPLGTAIFGIPFGFIIFLLTGKIVFLGVGLPLGMFVGLAIGAILDQRAKENNKVLFIRK